MTHRRRPSCQIGDFQVMALSDGNMTASLDLLSGIERNIAGEIQCQAGIIAPGNIHINAYLIRGHGRTLLVDSGTGGHNNTGGLLVQHLAENGVTPEDIDTILLTHGHPDHIGGLLNKEGQPTFPRAELFIHPLEVAHWQDDEKCRRANERVQRNVALVRRTLAAYEDKWHPLSENDIITGICPVWLPGHTPGHTGFRITSGGESLLIWGDIVHYPHIQTAHPATTIAFDVDPLQAEKTRKAILEQVAREKRLIAGMHFGAEGFARILAHDEGYSLVYINE